jgi:divinyl chlorophyllide a 8-vinyl-reductase
MPVGLLDAIIDAPGTAGRVLPALAAKAEPARIGRCYATESMLVLDPQTGRYARPPRPRRGP